MMLSMAGMLAAAALAEALVKMISGQFTVNGGKSQEDLRRLHLIFEQQCPSEPLSDSSSKTAYAGSPSPNYPEPSTLNKSQ